MKLLEALTSDGRERELTLALDPARIPAHIAIIMDGNGRWARPPRAASLCRAQSGRRDGSVCSGRLLTAGRESADSLRVSRRKTGSARAPKSICSGGFCVSICGMNWKI